jgi:hypothetical protein
MGKKRSFFLLYIILSFSLWLICPWNSLSLAASSYASTHTAHGHPSAHEEDTHHASKGNDHGCINPFSYSEEDTSSKISSVYLGALEIEAFTHQVTTVTIYLFDPHPPKFLIRLYQFYSVYRI